MNMTHAKSCEKQKTPIRKYNVVLANFLNYGVFFFGYIIVYIMLSFLFQSLLGLESIVATIIANVIMTILSFSLYFSFKYKKKLPSYQSHNNSMTLSKLLCWFFYFIVTSYCLLLFFQWFSLNVPDEGMLQRETDMQQHTIVFYLFYSCILAPLAEESIMRLYAYNQLKRSSNWIVAMIVSSFVFALLHGTFTHAVIATLFGVILTLSYEYTSCFYMPILGHVIYNFMALFTTSDMFFANNNVLVLIIAALFVIMLVVQIVIQSRKMSKISYCDMLK